VAPGAPEGARGGSPGLGRRGDWERTLETLDREVRLVLEQQRRALAVAGHLSRADDLVRRARWPEAIAAMTQAIELDPEQHGPRYHMATLFVEAGDVTGYDRHRRALLDRYGSTDSPQVAERTSKACLLLPGPADVIRRAAGLAELALDHRAEAGGTLPYFLLASGLAEYRLERFDAAEKRLREALASEGRSWNLRVPAQLVLAMALRKQGRGDEALALRTAALTILDREVPRLDQIHDDAWHDVLICRALRREAESLTRDDGSPSDRSQRTGQR
jgi:tetratricopeptide (TPR) repeat protein